MLVFAFYGCSVESIDSNEEIITADAKGTAAVQDVDSNEFDYPAEKVCLGEDINFSFNVPIGTNNIKIQELVDGEWEQIFQKSKSEANPETFSLEYPVGTYYFRYFAGPGGSTEIEAITVEDCSDCEESFSYSQNLDGSYTFTYIPEEDMINAEIVFTFAQSVVFEWGESSIATDWKSSGQTEHAFLDLASCEVYEWTVTLQKDCSGNSPNSNVWTDFKVNDVSKKNGLSNIVQSCD